MNGKIPVGATIGGAYRFAFGRLFGVLGVVWLPIAITVAAALFLFRDVQMPLGGIDNSEGAFRNFGLLYASIMGPFYVFQLVLWVTSIMIEVGLTRLALGIGGAPVAYFNLGASFWRMLGANLIVAVIVTIVILPFIFVVIVAAGTAGAMAGAGGQMTIDPSVVPWIVIGALVVGLATFIAFYYVYLRLWFFLAPVVVAEEHIDLRPGWRLAKGNVLRIFVILLAVTIPPLLLLFVAEGIGLHMMMSHDWTTFPDATFFAERWPQLAAIIALATLGWLFATAAVMGARAFAYRALAPAVQTIVDTTEH
jgi:hypothetical protein